MKREAIERGEGGATPLRRAVLAGRVVAGMSFNEKVWALTARIPAGRVTTYRHLAHALGTRAYRAVGQALNRNPHAPAVPCHRVVGSDLRLVGFAGGLARKRRLLAGEGVKITGERVDAAAVVDVPGRRLSG